MPQTTIPLVGVATSRNTGLTQVSSNTDQRFIATLFEVATDLVTGTKIAYVRKRFGISTSTTPAAGSVGGRVFNSKGGSTATVSAFGTSTSAIFYNTTSCGSLSGLARSITDTLISDIVFFLITSSDGTGWYLPEDTMSVSNTFTGDRTSGSPIVTGVSSVSGLYSGQIAAGTGFTAANRILSVDSASQVTMTENASSGAPTNTTFTREDIAKILDADFPSTSTGGFSQMNGRIFIGTTTGRIYNSALNSASSWSANDYISTDDYADGGQGCARVGPYILGLGNGSIEFFEFVFNASGSPLSRNKGLTQLIGVAGSTVCRLKNYVFFLSTRIGPDRGVYVISGSEVRKISTPEVDRALTGTPELSAYELDGYDYVLVSNTGTPVRSYQFNMDLNIWNESGFSSGSLRFDSNNGIRIVDAANSNTDGKVYTINPISSAAVYQDDSVAYTMTIQTDPKAFNSGMGFTVNGVHLLADNQSSGTTTLETSGDDYATWVTRGTFDMTANQKEIRRGGFYKNSCAFRLTHSANTPWRGQAIVVDWEPAVT